MAFTYSGDPASTSRDAVRFLIHDTDSSDPLMTDSEILWLLSQSNDSVYQAAHDACYVLAGHFARKADMSKSVGDLSLTTTYSNRSAMYTELADKFMELSARREVPTPWAKADNMAATSDRTTYTGSDFVLGQFDYWPR